MYDYNPSPAETALLWLIIQRESKWNPIAKNPNSSATGLLQFIQTTWQTFGGLAGVDLNQYPRASTAPSLVQQAVGLLLLREVGPNSTESWAASGPYPSYHEVVGMLTAIGVKT